MEYVRRSDNVLPFPIKPKLIRFARDAVLRLSLSDLITEREAVEALEDLDASDDEVETVRLIYAVRRHV